jgi:hypothetical protein
MFKQAALIVAIATFGARAQTPAPAYVPGEPITFPVDAASSLTNLGRRMLINCESPDPAVKSACISKIEPRVLSCLPSITAFADKAQYKKAAKPYLGCVMPNPFCRGIEITSDEQMRAVCGRHT